MRLVLTAAAVVALSFSSFHAHARMSEAPPPVAGPVDRGVLEQHALVLTAEIETLQGELKAAVDAAQGDAQKAGTQVDAILADFQPRLDSFLNIYERFNAYLLDRTTGEEEQAALLAARDESVLALKAMPQSLRERALNPQLDTPQTTD